MHVNIKFVNFPQPGKKFGRLQLDNGMTIWVPPNLLDSFRAGMSCEIGTKEQLWGDKPVVVATTGPQQGYGGQQGSASSQGYNQGQSNTRTYQRPNTGFQPRVIQGGGGRPEPDARMIFVTGIVGRAMGSGKFSASEIAVLTQAAMQAYDLSQKPPVDQRQMPQEPPPPDQGDPGPGPDDFPGGP